MLTTILMRKLSDSAFLHTIKAYMND